MSASGRHGDEIKTVDDSADRRKPQRLPKHNISPKKKSRKYRNYLSKNQFGRKRPTLHTIPEVSFLENSSLPKEDTFVVANWNDILGEGEKSANLKHRKAVALAKVNARHVLDSWNDYQNHHSNLKPDADKSLPRPNSASSSILSSLSSPSSSSSSSSTSSRNRNYSDGVIKMPRQRVSHYIQAKDKGVNSNRGEHIHFQWDASTSITSAMTNSQNMPSAVGKLYQVKQRKRLQARMKPVDGVGSKSAPNMENNRRSGSSSGRSQRKKLTASSKEKSSTAKKLEERGSPGRAKPKTPKEAFAEGTSSGSKQAPELLNISKNNLMQISHEGQTDSDKENKYSSSKTASKIVNTNVNSKINYKSSLEDMDKDFSKNASALSSKSTKSVSFADTIPSHSKSKTNSFSKNMQATYLDIHNHIKQHSINHTRQAPLKETSTVTSPSSLGLEHKVLDRSSHHSIPPGSEINQSKLVDDRVIKLSTPNSKDGNSKQFDYSHIDGDRSENIARGKEKAKSKNKIKGRKDSTACPPEDYTPLSNGPLPPATFSTSGRNNDGNRDDYDDDNDVDDNVDNDNSGCSLPEQKYDTNKERQINHSTRLLPSDKSKVGGVVNENNEKRELEDAPLTWIKAAGEGQGNDHHHHNHHNHHQHSSSPSSFHPLFVSLKFNGNVLAPLPPQQGHNTSTIGTGFRSGDDGGGGSSISTADNSQGSSTNDNNGDDDNRDCDPSKTVGGGISNRRVSDVQNTHSDSDDRNRRRVNNQKNTHGKLIINASAADHSHKQQQQQQQQKEEQQGYSQKQKHQTTASKTQESNTNNKDKNNNTRKGNDSSNKTSSPLSMTSSIHENKSIKENNSLAASLSHSDSKTVTNNHRKNNVERNKTNKQNNRNNKAILARHQEGIKTNRHSNNDLDTSSTTTSTTTTTTTIANTITTTATTTITSTTNSSKITMTATTTTNTTTTTTTNTNTNTSSHNTQVEPSTDRIQMTTKFSNSTSVAQKSIKQRENKSEVTSSYQGYQFSAIPSPPDAIVSDNNNSVEHGKDDDITNNDASYDQTNTNALPLQGMSSNGEDNYNNSSNDSNSNSNSNDNTRSRITAKPGSSMSIVGCSVVSTNGFSDGVGVKTIQTDKGRILLDRDNNVSNEIAVGGDKTRTISSHDYGKEVRVSSNALLNEGGRVRLPIINDSSSTSGENEDLFAVGCQGNGQNKEKIYEQEGRELDAAVLLLQQPPKTTTGSQKGELVGGGVTGFDDGDAADRKGDNYNEVDERRDKLSLPSSSWKGNEVEIDVNGEFVRRGLNSCDVNSLIIGRTTDDRNGFSNEEDITENDGGNGFHYLPPTRNEKIHKNGVNPSPMNATHQSVESGSNHESVVSHSSLAMSKTSDLKNLKQGGSNSNSEKSTCLQSDSDRRERRNMISVISIGNQNEIKESKEGEFNTGSDNRSFVISDCVQKKTYSHSYNESRNENNRDCDSVKGDRAALGDAGMVRRETVENLSLESNFKGGGVHPGSRSKVNQDQETCNGIFTKPVMVRPKTAGMSSYAKDKIFTNQIGLQNIGGGVEVVDDGDSFMASYLIDGANFNDVSEEDDIKFINTDADYYEVFGYNDETRKILEATKVYPLGNFVPRQNRNRYSRESKGASKLSTQQELTHSSKKLVKDGKMEQHGKVVRGIHESRSVISKKIVPKLNLNISPDRNQNSYDIKDIHDKGGKKRGETHLNLSNEEKETKSKQDVREMVARCESDDSIYRTSQQSRFSQGKLVHKAQVRQLSNKSLIKKDASTNNTIPSSSSFNAIHNISHASKLSPSNLKHSPESGNFISDNKKHKSLGRNRKLSYDTVIEESILDTKLGKNFGTKNQEQNDVTARDVGSTNQTSLPYKSFSNARRRIRSEADIDTHTLVESEILGKTNSTKNQIVGSRVSGTNSLYRKHTGNTPNISHLPLPPHLKEAQAVSDISNQDTFPIDKTAKQKDVKQKSKPYDKDQSSKYQNGTFSVDQHVFVSKEEFRKRHSRHASVVSEPETYEETLERVKNKFGVNEESGDEECHANTRLSQSFHGRGTKSMNNNVPLSISLPKQNKMFKEDEQASRTTGAVRTNNNKAILTPLITGKDKDPGKITHAPMAAPLPPAKPRKLKPIIHHTSAHVQKQRHGLASGL